MTQPSRHTTAKLIVILCAIVILNPFVAAALLNGSTTGANSLTYARNYEDMVAGMLNTGFNTTITYTVNGTTYLTVPEFASSTACYMNSTGLATTYAGSGVNSTLYEVRSDAFSETGVVLSMSNQSDAFDAWYNFLVAMDKDCYGSLPCWVVIRNNSRVDLPGGGNDTAIDGSVRAGIALYNAANNTAFTAANRTKYDALADQFAADSYKYETISITTKLTRSGTNVTRLPMGGGDCAAAGLGCSTDQWDGYGGDIIKFFQLAGINTGNATYIAAASNFTLAFLSVSLQNDTDGDGFGVAPFNFNWLTTGTYLGHIDGGGVNSYHYSVANSQWEDSDAPRFENTCDALRIANLSTGITGAYANLSTYCTAWANSATLTNTTSCLQYYYNGTCSTSIRTGYYENGLGFFISTYHNTTYVKPKIDEILTHYSWSGNTFDGSSCGTAGMFRASKATKALGSAIGNDERFYSPAAPTPPTPENPTTTNDLTALERTLFIFMGLCAAVGTFVVTEDFSLTAIVSVTFFVIVLASIL